MAVKLQALLKASFLKMNDKLIQQCGILADELIVNPTKAIERLPTFSEFDSEFNQYLVGMYKAMGLDEYPNGVPVSASDLQYLVKSLREVDGEQYYTFANMIHWAYNIRRSEELGTWA